MFKTLVILVMLSFAFPCQAAPPFVESPDLVAGGPLVMWGSNCGSARTISYDATTDIYTETAPFGAPLISVDCGAVLFPSFVNDYQRKLRELLPEQSANPFMNEYLAFAAVVAEKVDRRKLSDAEAQYELARKMTELSERQSRIQSELLAAQRRVEADTASAQAAAAQQSEVKNEARRIEQELAARRAADEAAAQRASQESTARIRIEQQRLDLERDALQRQKDAADQQRRKELFGASMRLLFPPRPKVQTCTGTWMGNMWVQNCF